jgi:hypothetical protein
MARSATDFAEHNTQRAVEATQRAVEATNYGVSWLREIAEQNLNQSKAAADSWLTVTRKAVEALDQQASAIRKRPWSLRRKLYRARSTFCTGSIG